MHCTEEHTKTSICPSKSNHARHTGDLPVVLCDVVTGTRSHQQSPHQPTTSHRHTTDARHEHILMEMKPIPHTHILRYIQSYSKKYLYTTDCSDGTNHIITELSVSRDDCGSDSITLSYVYDIDSDDDDNDDDDPRRDIHPSY